MSLLNLKELVNLRKARGDHFIPDHVADFFSDNSLEVLENFGYNTPELLNEYSCALEDAVIALQKENTKLKGEINLVTKGNIVLDEIRKETKKEKKSKGKKNSKRVGKKNKM